MQIRFIPCLIFHNYKSEKSGGWVGMAGGGGNIAEILRKYTTSIKALAKKVCQNLTLNLPEIWYTPKAASCQIGLLMINKN